MLLVLVTMDAEETVLRDWQNWDLVEDRLVVEVVRDFKERFDKNLLGQAERSKNT